MAYTRHGHHIPGTTLDTVPPRYKARCGGPRLCRECGLDGKIVESIIQVRERDDMYRTPQKFVPKQTEPVEAMQLVGDMYDMVGVLTWIRNNGYSWVTKEDGKPGFFIDEETAFVVLRDVNGILTIIKQGDWVVKNQDGEFYVYSPDHFEKLYTPAT